MYSYICLLLLKQVELFACGLFGCIGCLIGCFCFLGLLGDLGLGTTCGLQLFDAGHLEVGDALAYGLEALDESKLLGVDDERLAEAVATTEVDLDERVCLAGEQGEAAVLVLIDEGVLLCRSLHREALDVVEALLRGVAHDGGPHLVGAVLLDIEDIVFVVVVGVEVREVELAVLEHHKDAVVAVELAQVLAMPVEVETQDVAVEPHLAAAERGGSVGLEPDALHLEAGEQIAHGAASLDAYLAEVFLDDGLAQVGHGLELYLDNLGLAVGVGCEVGDARAGLALGEVVLAVAVGAGDGKALDVVGAATSVAVYHIIYGALVVLLVDAYVDDARANEHLLGHAHNLVAAILVEEDDVVDG